MIPKECLRLLTNARFRRRPSRLTGQPFRLASIDPLPSVKIETAVGEGDHHGFAWRPWCFRCASAKLAGAVVHPTNGSAASGPAALMEMRGVIFLALTRVNPLFVICRSHTTDCGGHCRDRPRPEQPQLISLLENGVLGGWHAIGRYAHCQTTPVYLFNLSYRKLFGNERALSASTASGQPNDECVFKGEQRSVVSDTQTSQNHLLRPWVSF
jgi:hypothetical protein